jgi:type I restriction enzyme S subunit
MSDLWKEISISECLSASFSGDWGAEPKPANVVVFRATDIDDEGRIIGSGAERRLPIGKLAAKRLQPGDVLLEGSGGGPDKPVGRVAYFFGSGFDQPAVCSNFFKTLRPNRDQIDPRFLLRKLAWFYKQPPLLALQQQTTGIINLKFQEYLKSIIRIPASIEEQAQIAQILDTLDTAIHETEAIIAKLKAVKQGLLHDLLTRGIDASGELRPPQSEAPQLYKQSPLGWIPKEWEVSHLVDCAQISSGVTLGREVSGQGIVELPYLRVANVQDGYLDLSEIKTVRILRSEIERFALQNGDVLMNEGGDFDKLGRGTVWRAQIDPCLHQNHVFRVRCNTARLVPDFLAAYSASQRGKAFFIQSSKQSTNLASINSSQLKAFPLALPGIDEQREVIDRLDSMNERLSSEELELKKLTATKSGLMDDLLTGRVRVTPLLEPAG